MERIPEDNEERPPETSQASKKRIEEFFNQLVQKKPELLKQLEEKWPYLVGASSAMLSLGLLIWYLEKKAQRGRKESLKEVIKEIAEKTLPETDPLGKSQKVGEASILLAAPEVAQDFEQLEKGKGKEEFETWLKRISKILKTPPLIKDVSENLSENLVAPVMAFVIRVLEPEKEKELNQK